LLHLWKSIRHAKDTALPLGLITAYLISINWDTQESPTWRNFLQRRIFDQAVSLGNQHIRVVLDIVGMLDCSALGIQLGHPQFVALVFLLLRVEQLHSCSFAEYLVGIGRGGMDSPDSMELFGIPDDRRTAGLL
jgi:hypothetical protein